jgi:hypothetical protein
VQRYALLTSIYLGVAYVHVMVPQVRLKYQLFALQVMLEVQGSGAPDMRYVGVMGG